MPAHVESLPPTIIIKSAREAYIASRAMAAAVNIDDDNQSNISVRHQGETKPEYIDECAFVGRIINHKKYIVLDPEQSKAVVSGLGAIVTQNARYRGVTPHEALEFVGMLWPEPEETMAPPEFPDQEYVILEARTNKAQA